MMEDSGDEESLQDYIPFSKRPDWSDVKPLEQDDGENPVVQIVYSERFKEVFDYFRGIVAISEKSERALELTKVALSLNAANYTVWQYRRDILKALNSDLESELEYVEDVILSNPKNYQVWHHRRVIVELLNDPSLELQLTEEVLLSDAKNYHAWQHRQWVIYNFKLFDDELTYCDKLISQDLRNNSAWNQRYFVLKHTGFTVDILEREVNYVINRIRLVKSNESAWNFLRGLLHQGTGELDQFPQVIEFCEELRRANEKSPYLYAFLIDYYEEICLRDYDENPMECKAYSDLVLELCNLMINKFDVIRSKYWEYVRENFKCKYSEKQNTFKELSTTNSSHAMST